MGREDSRCHGGTETGGVWAERCRQSKHWQTLWPHIHADKPRGPDSEWRIAHCGTTFAHR